MFFTTGHQIESLAADPSTKLKWAVVTTYQSVRLYVQRLKAECFFPLTSFVAERLNLCYDNCQLIRLSPQDRVKETAVTAMSEAFETLIYRHLALDALQSYLASSKSGPAGSKSMRNALYKECKWPSLLAHVDTVVSLEPTSVSNELPI